ncbi:hypothetical protein JS518_14220 [Clostridiales bacterium FE2010]|nr:hypothetical protein JS518_14220 [Clostridiales bacterium FE2010]
MATASIVFWVLFGALYIWYQAAKENPERVISETIACILLVLGIITFFFTVSWLGSISIILGILFAVICLGFITYHCYKVQRKDNEILKNLSDRYNQVMDIVNQETYTDKELHEYAVSWARIPDNRWKYKMYGFDGCKDKIIKDYRKYVRYSIISKELQENEANTDN